MAASELFKLWASPPTVSPSVRSSSFLASDTRESVRRRPRSRAQLRSVEHRAIELDLAPGHLARDVPDLFVVGEEERGVRPGPRLSRRPIQRRHPAASLLSA